MAVPEYNQQGGTRVIPGHGRIMNQSDVVEYRDMATIIRDRIAMLAKQGKTLDADQGDASDARLRRQLRLDHGTMDDRHVHRRSLQRSDGQARRASGARRKKARCEDWELTGRSSRLSAVRSQLRADS